MCGENSYLPIALLDNAGSPPRVRGKQHSRANTAGNGRITPACAGKTAWKKPGFLGRRDHPRVCGENPSVLAAVPTSSGSPPRVRGKRGNDDGKDNTVRITPACAGKTITTKDRFGMVRDHPRVCGENRESYQKNAISGGSPPRVRGKPILGWKMSSQQRITPACAGKTSGMSGVRQYR